MPAHDPKRSAGAETGRDLRCGPPCLSAGGGADAVAVGQLRQPPVLPGGLRPLARVRRRQRRAARRAVVSRGVRAAVATAPAAASAAAHALPAPSPAPRPSCPPRLGRGSLGIRLRSARARGGDPSRRRGLPRRPRRRPRSRCDSTGLSTVGPRPQATSSWKSRWAIVAGAGPDSSSPWSSTSAPGDEPNLPPSSSPRSSGPGPITCGGAACCGIGRTRLGTARRWRTAS